MAFSGPTSLAVWAAPAYKSQNQLEQDALLDVVRALPEGVRPVVSADRGFGRAGFLSWLIRHEIDYVVRLKKGGCVTEADGRQWKLSEEGPQRGQLRRVRGVRYGLYHGRPRDLFVNVALCWRKEPGSEEPPSQAARGAAVLVSCYKRLSRLLIALMVALGWLTLMGLPEVGVIAQGRALGGSSER